MPRRKPRGPNPNLKRRVKRAAFQRVPAHDQRATPLPCAECGKEAATLVDGARIYPHRPDLHRRSFWLCDCGAYCGCHPGTTFPLGAPAGRDTRAARVAAHDAFDPMWKVKAVRDNLPPHVARQAGYLWLADALGVDVRDCHISHMTAAQAMRVVELCEQARADARAAHAARAAGAATAYRATDTRADAGATVTKGTTA